LKGDTGPQGPTGPAGAVAAYFAAGAPTALASAVVTLPAGTYLLIATGTVQNNSSAYNNQVNCQLAGSSVTAAATVNLPPFDINTNTGLANSGTATIALQGYATTGGGLHVQLQCSTPSSDVGNLQLTSAQVSAIQVSTLTAF
jgi:hypothetical protein